LDTHVSLSYFETFKYICHLSILVDIWMVLFLNELDIFLSHLMISGNVTIWGYPTIAFMRSQIHLMISTNDFETCLGVCSNLKCVLKAAICHMFDICTAFHMKQKSTRALFLLHSIIRANDRYSISLISLITFCPLQNQLYYI
jgi:hypothetical protein